MVAALFQFDETVSLIASLPLLVAGGVNKLLQSSIIRTVTRMSHVEIRMYGVPELTFRRIANGWVW